MNRLRRTLRTAEQGWLERSWAELAGLVDQTPLDPEDLKLLRIRWLREAQHYDDLWRQKRIAFSVLGMLTVAAGLSTPLFAAFDFPKWTLALAGFVAALAGATEGFFRFGDRWRQQRHTAMLLKAEGLRFLELRPPYRKFGGHERAFAPFIDRLERINEAESEEYLALLSRELDSRESEEPEEGHSHATSARARPRDAR
jgi:hypothetical protein